MHYLSIEKARGYPEVSMPEGEVNGCERGRRTEREKRSEANLQR